MKTTELKIFYNGIKINGGKLLKCYYTKDEKSITIHADGVSLPSDLFEIENNSDPYRDYYSNDYTTITESHPLYQFFIYNYYKYAAKGAQKSLETFYEARGYKPNTDIINRYKNTIDIFNKLIDPKQPTSADLERVFYLRKQQEEEKARQKAEQEKAERLIYERKKAAAKFYIKEEMQIHPAREGAPVVLIEWSEHPAFSEWNDKKSLFYPLPQPTKF
jgi:hypothetical protein